MEVMIILLIMAVTLAATAPMISRKMSRNVGTAEEPWKYNGANESISFNGNGRDFSTVFIGTDRVLYPNHVTRLPRNSNQLVVSTSQVNAPYANRQIWRPHIEIASTGRLVRGANGRYWFLDDDGNMNSYFNMSDNDINVLLYGDKTDKDKTNDKGLYDELNDAQSALDQQYNNGAVDIDTLGTQLNALINAQNAVNNLSDNAIRGFVGFAETRLGLLTNLYLPFLSNRFPYNYHGRAMRGIVLGTRLEMTGNIDVEGSNDGVTEDNVQDKIVIGHDSTINCRAGGRDYDTNDIIMLGSDIGLRGDHAIVIGRDIGLTFAWRTMTEDIIMINTLGPQIPNNNTNVAGVPWIYYSAYQPGNPYEDAETASFRTLAIGDIIENTVRDITGIGQSLCTSGSGHTLIGNKVHCGRIWQIRLRMPLEPSYLSVAIGSSVSAAGSNCVAIGNNLVAGFPPTDDQVRTDNPDRLTLDNYDDARNNTVVIGVSNDHFHHSVNTQNNANYTNMGIPNSLNATAANAVVIGSGASAREARNRTINNHDNPSNGIAIGTGARVTRANAIAIGSGDFSSMTLQNQMGNTIDDADFIREFVSNDSARATNNNSVAIGAGANTDLNNQIVLGTALHTVVIPGDLEIRGDFFFKGQPITVDTPTGYGFTALSDSRLKNLGEKLTSGLEDIKKLEFFNYTFKDDKEQKPHVGVMAQDLQKVFPTSVSEGSDGYLRIRWDEMFYAALNAIKELDRKIIALAEDVKSFFERVDSIELRVAQSQKALDDLKSDFADIDMRLKALEE